jgi:hypothetical protein
VVLVAFSLDFIFPIFHQSEERALIDSEVIDSDANDIPRQRLLENETYRIEGSEVTSRELFVADPQADCQRALNDLLRMEELNQDASNLSERLGRIQSLTNLMSPVGGIEVGLFPEELFHLPSSLSIISKVMLDYHKQLDSILENGVSADIDRNLEAVRRQVRIKGFLEQLEILASIAELENSPSLLSKICEKLHSLNLGLSKEFRDQKVLLDEMREETEEIQGLSDSNVHREFNSSFGILLEDSRLRSLSINRKISPQVLSQNCLGVLLEKKNLNPRFAFLDRRLARIKVLTNLMATKGGIDVSRYPQEYFNTFEPANDSSLRKCAKRMFGFYEKLAILKKNGLEMGGDSELLFSQLEELVLTQVKIEGLSSQLDSLHEVSEKNHDFLRFQKICEKMQPIKNSLFREIDEQGVRLESLQGQVGPNQEELRQFIHFISTVLYLGKYRQEESEDKVYSKIFDLPLSSTALNDSVLIGNVSVHIKSLLGMRVEIEKMLLSLNELSPNFDGNIDKQASIDSLNDFGNSMQRLLSILSETSEVLQRIEISSSRKEHLVKSMGNRINQVSKAAIKLNELAFSKLIRDRIPTGTNLGNFVSDTKQLTELLLAFPIAMDASKIQEQFAVLSASSKPEAEMLLRMLEFRGKPKEMGLCNSFVLKASNVEHWTPKAIEDIVKSQFMIQKYLFDHKKIMGVLNEPKNYAEINSKCLEHKAVKKALFKEVDQVEIFRKRIEVDSLNNDERAYFEYIKTYLVDLKKGLSEVKKVDYDKKRQTEIEKRYFLRSLAGKVQGIESNSTKFTLNSWKNFFKFQKEDSDAYPVERSEAKDWFKKISGEFAQQSGKKYGVGTVGIVSAGMYSRNYAWTHAAILYQRVGDSKIKLSHVVENIDKETLKKAGQDYVNDDLKFQDLEKYKFYKVDCSKLVFAKCTQVFLQKIYGNNWKKSLQEMYEGEQKKFHTACLEKFADETSRKVAGRTVELNNSYWGWPRQTSYWGLGGQVGGLGYTNLVRAAEAVANTAIPGYNFGYRASAAITNLADRPRKIHDRMKRLIDLTNSEDESMICSDFVLSSIIYSFEEMKVKLAKEMGKEIRSPNKTSGINDKTREEVKTFLGAYRHRIFELPLGVILDPCKTLPYNLKTTRLKRLLKEQKGEPDIRKQLLNTVIEQKSLPKVGTTKSPSMTSFNGRLYFTWRSAQSDQAIWFCSMEGVDSISRQKKIPNDGTSESPSFTEYDGKLYFAMKTALDDKKIWYRSMDRVENWSAPKSIPDVQTNKSPALTEFNGKLYFFWSSASSDKGIWKRSLTGEDTWSDQSKVINAKTDDSPAVTKFNNRLFMAWKEEGTGKIRYSSMNKNESWTGQKIVPAAKSTTAPSLLAFRDKLYASWKGSDGNKSIWFSVMDRSGKWTQPEEISCVSTQDKPTMAVFENSLYLGWKGTDDKVWRTVIS